MITKRIKFSKTGRACYFSHLDLQRVMARALKKSGLPVWYSEGYNPHIYMTFTLPLSLGHESVCDSVDFKLSEDCSEEMVITALQGTLPMGIDIMSVGEPAFKATDIKYAEYKVTLFDNCDAIKNALNEFASLETAIVLKPTKKKILKEINLKEFIRNMSITEESDNSITFTALYPAGTELNLNPGLLLEFLSNNYDLQILDSHIMRTSLYSANIEILE